MAEDTVPESKEVRVLKAKIETKQEMVRAIGWVGPVIPVVAGLLICIIFFFSLYIFLAGLVVLGIGIWWTKKRGDERMRLLYEIKELEAELQA